MHSTAQHSTAQHSTAQHSTAHTNYTTNIEVLPGLLSSVKRIKAAGQLSGYAARQKAAKQLGSEAAKSNGVIADLIRNRKTIKHYSTTMRFRVKHGMTEDVNNFSTVQPFNHSTSDNDTIFLCRNLLCRKQLSGWAAMQLSKKRLSG